MFLKIGSKPVSTWKWFNASLLLLALLQAPLLWAVDTDSDGSDDAEELLAGTNPANPDERPYWWKTFNGDNEEHVFGISVSDAGDVNNDGYADIIIGAIGDNNNGYYSGAARVLSGVDGSVLHNFYGENAGDYFGSTVSGAGDVNGDGYADIVIGAWNGVDSGSVRVLSGLDGSALYIFNGDNADDYFGRSVSGAGDVNGDGYADIIVGAFTDNNNGVASGSARVFSGANGSVLYTFYGDSDGDLFGTSVSGAGDVNGDGFADIVVGADSDDNNGDGSGSARVFSGVDGSVLYTFNGDSAEDYFGGSVSDAGDVNNDGYADIVVGALFDDNNGNDSGSARVLSGQDGSVLYTFNGDGAHEIFGHSVSGAGDVNNDGYADIVVGAYGDGSVGLGSGKARVYSGLDGSVLYTFSGDSADDYFGFSVSGAGDLNGDGLADIVIGAPNDDHNFRSSGSVRVILSSDLNNDTDLDSIPNNADLDDDNDGISDLVEGTYAFLDPLNAGDALLDQDGDGSSNLAEIVAGTDPTDPTDFPLRAVYSDFNGDGRADILWRKASAAQTALVLTNNAAAEENVINSGLILSGWSAQQGDFNADARVDLLWRNSVSGEASIELSGPDGAVIERLVLENRSSYWGSDIGDFNGDGIDDILWRQPVLGKVQVAISAADGSTERLENLSRRYGAWQHQLGDFNGDNRTDILWRKPSTGKVEVVLSNAMGNQGVVSEHSNKWSAWTVTIGDFNGDGRDDVLWRKASNGVVQVAISGVAGEQDSVITRGGRYNAWTDTVGDFNGDGRDDILWRRPASGEVEIIVSDDQGGQSVGVTHLAKFSAWQHAVGDYNGDGIDDILWRKPAVGTVNIIINNASAEQANVVDHFDKGENWYLVR